MVDNNMKYIIMSSFNQDNDSAQSLIYQIYTMPFNSYLSVIGILSIDGVNHRTGYKRCERNENEDDEDKIIKKEWLKSAVAWYSQCRLSEHYSLCDCLPWSNRRRATSVAKLKQLVVSSNNE
jgi:hypothetical protein